MEYARPAGEYGDPKVSGSHVSAKVFGAVVIGNAIEVFDFIIYAQFAVYIGRAFFPAVTPLASLLLSVAVFGVGFFSRPLGGVVIGAYADRYGRRPALILTITLITVGTLGLALTPTYAQIGIAAPLIVVAARLVQGFALGGEVGPASAYMFEAAPPHRQGTSLSWQLASQGIATFVAGLVGLALSYAMPASALEAWGWRIPFLLCVLLVPIALHLRRAMPETAEARRPQGTSLRRGLSEHARLIFLVVCMLGGHSVSIYASLYMATYAVAALHLPASTALASIVVVGASMLVGALLGGRLADRFKRRPLMLLPSGLVAVAVVPLFLWITAARSAEALWCTAAALAFLTVISSSAGLVTVTTLFPRSIRASGLAMSYAVGIALFGGTAQFVFTWLIGTTGSDVAPAWYVAALAVIGSAAMWCFPETRDDATASRRDAASGTASAPRNPDMEPLGLDG